MTFIYFFNNMYIILNQGVKLIAKHIISPLERVTVTLEGRV